MKNNHSFLAILLSLAILFTFLPIMTYAEVTGNSGEYSAELVFDSGKGPSDLVWLYEDDRINFNEVLQSIIIKKNGVSYREYKKAHAGGSSYYWDNATDRDSLGFYVVSFDDSRNKARIKFYNYKEYADLGDEAFSFEQEVDATIKHEVFDISKTTISGLKNKTYTGKAITQDLLVMYNGRGLAKGLDYKVTYKNNINVGTATVTITGRDYFKGSKTVSFKINPKGTSAPSLTAKRKGFIAKWKKGTGISGYEIWYALNSKFTTGKKIVTITNHRTISRKVTKLKAKKKYYVKIRTYKTVNGKKYYSAWSKAKTVTPRK